VTTALIDSTAMIVVIKKGMPERCIQALQMSVVTMQASQMSIVTVLRIVVMVGEEATWSTMVMTVSTAVEAVATAEQVEAAEEAVATVEEVADHMSVDMDVVRRLHLSAIVLIFLVEVIDAEAECSREAVFPAG